MSTKIEQNSRPVRYIAGAGGFNHRKVPVRMVLHSINDISSEILAIDCEREVERIAASMKAALIRFRRKGFVVAVSGGIDSSATLALCVRAVGRERVLALQMPECNSAPETLGLSGRAADAFGVEKIHEDITPILESVGYYRRYTEAVRKTIPEYDDLWKSKIVLPDTVHNDSFAVYSIVAQAPDGRVVRHRVNLEAYLGIVAATNFKQRIRKMMEYYHADRLNYAVTGTPNRLEYDQGFFVKLGDGAADVKPIAHLYKTQVYQIAAWLGVPRQILDRLPTTDTYSLPQGQDEFYFSLPYDKMDLCLYARNNGIPASAVAGAVGLTEEQVERVFRDIDQKRSTTCYLHHSPLLVAPVNEITH